MALPLWCHSVQGYHYGRLLPQVAALTQFAETNGYLVPPEWQFQDDGYSGAIAVPEFQPRDSAIRKLTDRHYVVNVMGDYKPAKLQGRSRGLAGLLKHQVSGERIGAACRQIVLQASEHSRNTGRNLITVEMDSTGKYYCSY